MIVLFSIDCRRNCGRCQGLFLLPSGIHRGLCVIRDGKLVPGRRDTPEENPLVGGGAPFVEKTWVCRALHHPRGLIRCSPTRLGAKQRGLLNFVRHLFPDEPISSSPGNQRRSRTGPVRTGTYLGAIFHFIILFISVNEVQLGNPIPQFYIRKSYNSLIIPILTGKFHFPYFGFPDAPRPPRLDFRRLWQG